MVLCLHYGAPPLCRLIMGLTVRVEARSLASVQTGPGAHQASCTAGIRPLSRGTAAGGGVTYPLHPVPKLKKVFLSLRGFLACYRANFTFYLIMHFPPVHWYLVPLRPQSFSQHCLSEIPQRMFPL